MWRRIVKISGVRRRWLRAPSTMTSLTCGHSLSKTTPPRNNRQQRLHWEKQMSSPLYNFHPFLYWDCTFHWGQKSHSLFWVYLSLKTTRTKCSMWELKSKLVPQKCNYRGITRQDLYRHIFITIICCIFLSPLTSFDTRSCLVVCALCCVFIDSL